MKDADYNLALVREWSMQKALAIFLHNSKTNQNSITISTDEIIADAKKIAAFYENKEGAKLVPINGGVAK